MQSNCECMKWTNSIGRRSYLFRARSSPLFVVSISPEGDVLAFTKQIDLNVKAVKSLYFHSGRLPEGMTKLLHAEASDESGIKDE
ncbi:hypothetical protein PMAYCL1PPCAC_10725 [Pristionchus mayeri]|uniref:Uncharacterized protein n=1 Tax=Pristionchus mayeri TaxID=1317129 RepID=A0AAN4ZP41_9BILA|nr:hypothetical protein PMAYCL1PPCAC_10725 [Pristionchus mayeri]